MEVNIWKKKRIKGKAQGFISNCVKKAKPKNYDRILIGGD